MARGTSWLQLACTVALFAAVVVVGFMMVSHKRTRTSKLLDVEAGEAGGGEEDPFPTYSTSSYTRGKAECVQQAKQNLLHNTSS